MTDGYPLDGTREAQAHLLEAQGEIGGWSTHETLTTAEQLMRQQFNATNAIGWALLDIAESLRKLSGRQPIEKVDFD